MAALFTSPPATAAPAPLAVVPAGMVAEPLGAQPAAATGAVTTAEAQPRVRAYRAADELAVRRFLAGLSLDTRYRRFFTGGALPERLVRRLLDVDGRDRVAAVLTHGGEVVGLANCMPADAAPGSDVELAVVLAEAWQGRGHGAALASYAVALAAAHGARFVRATVHPENAHAVRAITRRYPAVRPVAADGVYTYRVPAAAAAVSHQNALTVTPLE